METINLFRRSHSTGRLLRALCFSLSAFTLSACQTITGNAALEQVASGKADPSPSVTTKPMTTAAPVPVGCKQGEAAIDCDRRAILAMAGEYAVDFRFEEIAALQPGYVLKAPQLSKAREFIIVLEDTGRRIVLQHILVAQDGHVTKHWRQDWLYETTELWRYQGVQSQQSWQRETVAAETVKGRWVQFVWQVDDSPRYAGIGQWQHDGNNSIWTSDVSWRPLPRREHTSRSDYDIMVAINRHEITPTGWLHWQDNLKQVSTATPDQRYLAREFGANTYTRITGYDFKPGYDYWQRTQSFWQGVRAAWSARFAANTQITMQDKVADKTLWLALFEEAANVSAGQPIDQQQIETILNQFLRVEPAAATAHRHAGR